MNHKKFFLVIIKVSVLLLIVCISIFSTSNSQDTSINKQKEHKFPSFDDFPILDTFKGIPAKVDLSSNPYAKKFRTVLREGAKIGPNFAGHFRLVEWGCGSSCQSHAIVDAKNGKVFFPFNLVTTAGIDFRLSSSLVITDPIDTLSLETIPVLYSYYYNWDGKKLILIDSLKIQ
ncbi:MAG: hypothetical protein WCS69_06175 [Ignavibacteriaceae bacterium]|jgi:hypothetical protein